MIADEYTFSVAWSVMDQQYVGTCAEFGGLSYLGPSRSAALAGIRALVQDAGVGMERSGRPVPTPLPPKRFSGKLMVRVPPSLHQQLSMEAAAAGMSLNRLIASRLGADSSVHALHAQGASPDAANAGKRADNFPAVTAQKAAT